MEDLTLSRRSLAATDRRSMAKADEAAAAEILIEMLCVGIRAVLESPPAGGAAGERHLEVKGITYDFTGFVLSESVEIRLASGLNTGEYLEAMAGKVEILSGGRSGSMVCRSADQRLVFKTMKQEELDLLLSIMDKYVAHLHQYPFSLLSRFLGLYRVKRPGHTHIFMVMENVLNKGVRIDEVYDLKGSSVDREVTRRQSRSSKVNFGKDMDLKRRLRMDGHANREVMQQARIDVQFLSGRKLMDYSLLLGVHVCDPNCVHDESLCKF
jgi:hypothetical protein